MTSRTVRFKHLGSCLSDVEFSFDINHEKKTIGITLRTFDSALFASFIEMLEREDGILAYADDNTSWNPIRPLWLLRVSIAGVWYRADVARLIDTTGTNRRDFAVALIPVDGQWAA